MRPRYKKIPDTTAIGIFASCGRRARLPSTSACTQKPVSLVSWMDSMVSDRAPTTGTTAAAAAAAPSPSAAGGGDADEAVSKVAICRTWFRLWKVTSKGTVNDA